MYCRIYVGGLNISESIVRNLVRDHFSIGENEIQYIEIDNCMLEIRDNKDFDAIKQREFPDGFIYFPYSIEISNDIESEREIFVQVVDGILELLWKENLTAIASSSFEDYFSERGGYRSEKVPWFM
jgi:hypothetical protein